MATASKKAQSKCKPSTVCSAHARTLRKRGSRSSASVLASDCKKQKTARKKTGCKK